MADGYRAGSGSGTSEVLSRERTYAMLCKLCDEVRELASQIRALRKTVEGNDKK